MSDAHEETGYNHKRGEKRVPIRDYGKTLKAEKAKELLKKIKGQLTN